MSACIGTPISWPRLERHASGPADEAVAEHVAACAVCRACLDEITRDVVALPVLAAAVTTRRVRWWWVALPAFAAAALALLLVWPRPPERAGNVALLKGGGEVTLGLVRERAGAIRGRHDVRARRSLEGRRDVHARPWHVGRRRRRRGRCDQS